VYYF
jgi:signal transduction histidine kinase